MNKLFYYHTTEKINGKETYSSGFEKLMYHYGDPDESKIVNRIFADFNVLYNSGNLLHAYRDQTLFKHNPIIRYMDKYGHCKSVNEKDFNTYSLTTEIKEVTYRITMEELMHRLSAEEFALWCLDHGLSVCPMNK